MLRIGFMAKVRISWQKSRKAAFKRASGRINRLATIERFSTSDIAPMKRLAVWNDASEAAFGVLVVDADRFSFEAALTHLKAGDLEIFALQSSPVIARSLAPTPSGTPNFLLQIVQAGQCHIRQGSLERGIVTGDLMVTDLSKPYELHCQEQVHGLTIPLPIERFGPLAESLEMFAGRAINVSNGPGAVLSNFLRGTWEHLAVGNGENWPASAETLVWDLLQAVIEGSLDHSFSNRADDLRQAAKAHIEINFSDPDFGVAKMGGALGVSARYLQTVFAQVGTTPSRYLLARRLQAAAEQLKRSTDSNSVTTVAFDCGFNDLSYFSRTFRKRYRVSPRDFRQSSDINLQGWQ